MGVVGKAGNQMLDWPPRNGSHNTVRFTGQEEAGESEG